MHYDRFVTHSPQQSSLLFARLNSHLYLSTYVATLSGFGSLLLRSPICISKDTGRSGRRGTMGRLSCDLIVGRIFWPNDYVISTERNGG
jgi:hypothetical protein